MKRRALVLSSILAGLCLLLMGLVWKSLVPSTAYWSPEQAEEYTAAHQDMHSKSHQHGDTAEKEMALARERFAKISNQLEQARGTQKFGSTVFLAAGVLLLLAGVGLHFVQNRSQ